MKAGIQRQLAELGALATLIGSDGCYALAIAQAGWPLRDDTEVLSFCKQARALGFINASGSVTDAEALMALAAGGQWSCEMAEAGAKAPAGSIVIEKWAYTNAMTGKYYEHFGWRQPDGTLWDPLGDSETFKQGRCIGKRFFKRLKA